MSALATILAQLAVAILQWVASREDLKQTVYDRVDREAAQRALVALGWMAAAPGRPDHGAGLRDDGGQLELGAAPDAHAQGPSGPGSVPH